LEITYLGQSAFRLRGKDVTVVTDPYPPGPQASMGKVTADVVTVSRPEREDVAGQSVAGEPRIVSGPGEYEVADILIAGVATSMEPGAGPLNTAYVVRFDDLAVCHLGDARAKLTDKQVEDLGSIDVLLIPVGGGGALGPAQAAEVVTQLEPALVIPMRYRLDGSTEEGIEPLDLFMREMGSKEFVQEPKLMVTKSSLPSEVRLVVLESKRV